MLRFKTNIIEVHRIKIPLPLFRVLLLWAFWTTFDEKAAIVADVFGFGFGQRYLMFFVGSCS
jgi:hypothetical protein